MLSITEIAKRLGVIESTARSIRDRYPDFVLRRRGPRGDLYSLERFIEISVLKGTGKVGRSTREVRAELARRYPLEASRQTLAEVNFEDSSSEGPAVQTADAEATIQALALAEVGDVLREQQAAQQQALAEALRSAFGEGSPLLLAFGRLFDQQDVARVERAGLGVRQQDVLERLGQHHELLERLAEQQRALTDVTRQHAELLGHLVELHRLALPPPEPPRYSLRWFWWRLFG